MSIADKPDRIYDIFKIEEKNSAGVYATKMWLLGMPITVILDDFLPVEQWGKKFTRYAQVASDGALWGTIIEKSFAKYLGMYIGPLAPYSSYGSPMRKFGQRVSILHYARAHYGKHVGYSRLD